MHVPVIFHAHRSLGWGGGVQKLYPLPPKTKSQTFPSNFLASVSPCKIKCHGTGTPHYTNQAPNLSTLITLRQLTKP